MRSAFVTPLLLSFALCSGHALADDSAVEKFKAAQTAFDSEKYEEALTLAREAHALSGSPNARLYVARSLKALGRFDEAHEEMAATLRESMKLAENERKYVATRDAAAAELALLDQKVGKVIIVIAGAPEGASVELNEKPLTKERIGIPIAVFPGSVAIRVTAPGKKPLERFVDVTAGKTQSVALTLEAADETDEEPAPMQPQPGAPASSGGGLRTAGFVTAGVGVAGLAVFGIFGSMASAKHSQLEDECGGSRCTDPKYADVVDSGKRAQTVANVGLIVGAAGVLAGGAMIAFGGPSAEKAPGPTASVAHGGFSLGYAGRF